MTKQVSSRQTGIIASLILFANKILVLPSLFYEKSQADGLFMVAILLAFELLILYLFLKVKEAYPDQSFYSIIQEKMGTFVAKAFYIILMLYFFYKIMLLFNIIYMYLKVQVYIDASYYIFIFAFLVIMNTSVLRGIRPIARGCEFFYVFIMASLVFCLLLSIANFDKLPIFFDSSLKAFFDGIFRHSFCFGDLLLLFIIMDKLEVKKKDHKRIFAYISFSVVITLLIYFMFYCIFGVTSFVHKNAVSDIMTFSYRFIDLGRLDLVAIITIMFLAFFQLSLYAYVFSECFTKVFSKLSFTYSVVVFDILFVGVVISSLINYLVAIKIGQEFICYLAILLHLILPLIVFFFAKNKQKRRKE